jgi:hypothetical protein
LCKRSWCSGHKSACSSHRLICRKHGIFRLSDMTLQAFRRSCRLQAPSTGFLPFFLEADRTKKKVINESQTLATRFLPAFLADTKSLVRVDGVSAGKYDRFEFVYRQ